MRRLKQDVVYKRCVEFPPPCNFHLIILKICLKLILPSPTIKLADVYIFHVILLLSKYGNNANTANDATMATLQICYCDY